MSSNRRGFTLIELVVTVLIAGILMSVAVPQYLKTVETGKADDAVATVNMIATTNKMFALDHSGLYAYGAFPATAGATCAAGGVTCPAAALASYPSACYLVACKYLADQDWGDKPYSYSACNAAAAGGGSPNVSCTGTLIAVANRGGTAAVAASSPYSTWGYSAAQTGVIAAVNSAPPPTF